LLSTVGRRTSPTCLHLSAPFPERRGLGPSHDPGCGHALRQGGDISSARRWAGGHAWQARSFHKAYGWLHEGSTVLMLCSPFPSCFTRSPVSQCSKTTVRLIPVTTVDFTLVVSGNVLNDIQLTPADVCRVDC